MKLNIPVEGELKIYTEHANGVVPVLLIGSEDQKIEAVVSRRNKQDISLVPRKPSRSPSGYPLPVTNANAKQTLNIILDFTDEVNKIVSGITVNAFTNENVKNRDFLYALMTTLESNWDALAEVAAKTVLARHLKMEEVTSLSPVTGTVSSSQFAEGLKLGRRSCQRLLVQAKELFVEARLQFIESLNIPADGPTVVFAFNRNPALALAKYGVYTLHDAPSASGPLDLTEQERAFVDEVSKQVSDTLHLVQTEEMKIRLAQGPVVVHIATRKRKDIDVDVITVYEVGSVHSDVVKLYDGKTPRDFCQNMVEIYLNEKFNEENIDEDMSP